MRAVVSVLTRVVRGMFACWLALVLSQPVTVRACPMTGGVLQQIAYGSAVGDAGGHGEGHHGHGGSSKSAAPTPAPAPSGSHGGHGHHEPPVERVVVSAATPHGGAPDHDHEKSECNCIGDSCSVMAIALPTLGTFIPAPRHVIERRAPVRTEAPSFEAPAYLLPPSTAPPGTHA